MREGLIFEEKRCSRLDSRGGERSEHMMVATEFIERGRVIINQAPWMVQVSFVATSDEDVAPHGEKLGEFCWIFLDWYVLANGKL